MANLLTTFPWTVPTFAPVSFPALPALTLTDREKDLIGRMTQRRQADEHDLLLENAYYMGEQIVENLKIAIPEDLAKKLRTIVGWPRIAVDPYVERMGVDGFRLPGETDINSDLADLWAENDCATEQSMAFTDALAMRRSYWLVGSAPEPGGAPRVTVESPLNMTVLWDSTGRIPAAAWQTFHVDETPHATLLLPEQTIEVEADSRGQWVVVNRDQHGYGRVSVTRMANNPRTYARNGFSEITPELMSIVDSACRTLLGLEVARELYSVPKHLILGATEADFQDPTGATRTAWETYITRLLAFERDENGDVPDVKQLTAYDPTVYTKLIEMYASQAAGILAAVPQDLGLYTDGNPTSAEAAAVYEGRRDRRARRKQTQWSGSIVAVMQEAMRYQNGGDLPAQFRRIAVDWADVSLPTPTATTDAVTKQITAGAVPPVSDVTLKRLGYNAVERAQLAQDREAAASDSLLRDIATSLATGQATPAEQ